MNYIELYLAVEPDFADILVAELAQIGFESFTEEPDGIRAYIPEPEFDDALLAQLLTRYAELTTLRYQTTRIEAQNWNETWEQSYEAINVADRCLVRASFHPPAGQEFEVDIVINPKMSFGTGHHETTALMLEHQLDLDLAGKRVLDVGSGTGILAIMAAKRGASLVRAFDIEEWAATNALENVALNDCAQVVSIRQGTLETEPPAEYDLVLANINRNILLADMAGYARFLAPGGQLLVSGFYETDLPDITQAAIVAGLRPGLVKTKNGWVAARFEK
ncbi:MAG: 50S ribosomal protein L11 methyltransferase [Cytophagaceae bacterium]|nr:50S ribosomal protein L11 methyltransferase [Cytophagaceae bacterium]